MPIVTVSTRRFGLYLADHGAIDLHGIFRRQGEMGLCGDDGGGTRDLEMPLFLEPETYVNVQLETTYQGTPRRWREVLERV